MKGAHLAIEVAKRTGIPLKIAGEVQPMFRDYFEQVLKPQIDGRFIEYIGEADFETKNELLSNSLALLFPIEWDEPFGLIMIEAMACGTPVLAFAGFCAGSCEGRHQRLYLPVARLMVDRVADLNKLKPVTVRQYAQENPPEKDMGKFLLGVIFRNSRRKYARPIEKPTKQNIRWHELSAANSCQ